MHIQQLNVDDDQERFWDLIFISTLGNKETADFSFSFQYVFIVSLSGQELAPSPKPIGGCQWVIEPDLSPLLYKSIK